MQGLNKRMYCYLVPTFIQTVKLIPSLPKFEPKHLFINMVRTMNHETHQYKEIVFRLYDMDGRLCGEFNKSTDKPDGRCRFLTKDRNITVLCLFIDGVMLKGPSLFYDFKKTLVRVTSPTLESDGSLHFIVAEI